MGKKIVIDFEGVPLVSSSYADEVFGKIFSGLGPISFTQSFAFKNIDPLVEQLINKAIVQRMTDPWRGGDLDGNH
jgi:STAS-like domain of unknown function (DUF4325)